MKRLFLAVLAASLMTVAAQAHFVYVVPAKAGDAVTVVFSDDLEPDENVPITKIAGLKLTARDAAGKDTPVELVAEKHSLAGKLAGAGPRAVFGSVAYGVMAKGDAKPYLLTYHPKALVGPVNGKPVVVGAPLEVVPVPAGGRTAFKVVAAGKPVADAEVTVTLPDGKKEKVKTNAEGRTDGFAGDGRFAVFAKNIEAKAGEHGGKKYEEVRHYATLVATVVENPTAQPGTAAADAPASPYPPLPKGVASLGAIAADGYLYVYGGHCGETHTYDTESVIGTFHRLKLDGGTKWEALPGGPILQGMNLAAHDGKIYRVGGMTPRNAPGEPTDNVSVTDAARFDPKVGKWEPLPAMPAGRSSHDVVVVGDKLVVVGGWNQKGKGEKPEWHETALVMDLSAKEPKWETVPQPFKRRALTAAVVGTKVYVLGGLGADGKPTDVFDVATKAWSQAPTIPGDGARAMAFSPAATTANGRLIVNISAGPVYRLSKDGAEWEKVGAAAKKRMVARLVPLGPDAVVLVGGAGAGGHLDTVEVIKLTQ